MVKILSKKQPGTAMLLTLLLAGAIGVVLFSISQLTASEILAGREIREGILSYYAAEAGLEKGLLEYRQNHDIIKSDIVSSLPNGAKSTAEINYLGVAKGELAKDSKIEIAIANPGETLILTFTNQPITANAKIDYQRVDKIGFNWLTTQRGIIDITGVGVAKSQTIGTLPTSQKIVLRAFSGAVNYEITSNRPAGADTGISTINSTGTAGSTSRQLQAKIDRSKNQLIGIFDFTVYSEKELSP